MSSLELLLHDEDTVVSHLIANYVPHAIIAAMMDDSVRSYSRSHKNKKTHLLTHSLPYIYTQVPDPSQSENLPVIQSYETSCLALEIAGMADLSVSMAKSQGKTYLEYVDIVMNQLKREGGDLIKMDEGTFVCVWPKGGKSSAERARHAAQCAVSMYRDFFSKQQKENNPSLKIRAGIGFGNMSFLHIGGTNEEIEYVAIGEGLEDALCALKTCQPGEIMVASNAVSVLGNAFNTTKTRRKGNPSVMDFHVACNMRLDPFVFNAMKALGDMDEDDADEFDMKLMKYVPGEIMRHITGDHDHQELWSNDVRPITVVRLSGKMDTFGKKTEEIASLWNRFTKSVQSLCFEYDGFVVETSAGIEDTCFMMCAFGLAPKQHADDAMRGVRNILGITLTRMSSFIHSFI